MSNPHFTAGVISATEGHERRKAMLVKDRPYHAYEGNDWQEGEREPVQQQSSDIFVLQRSKELLCELWKQGRVTAEVRFAAENALSAALEAVENPVLKKVTLAEGAYYSGQQFQREQARKNEEF